MKSKQMLQCAFTCTVDEEQADAAVCLYMHGGWRASRGCSVPLHARWMKSKQRMQCAFTYTVDEEQADAAVCLYMHGGWRASKGCSVPLHARWNNFRISCLRFLCVVNVTSLFELYCPRHRFENYQDGQSTFYGFPKGQSSDSLSILSKV